MNFLLDTHICIHLITQKSLTLLQKFKAYSVGDIGISSITVAELQLGVQKSQFPEQNQQALEQFLLPLIIVNFDSSAAAMYGKIKAKIDKYDTSLDILDTLIIAHALSLKATLITNRIDKFQQVPNLEIENWQN